jgi:hypothetical protein
MAVLALRKRDTATAIRRWLNILELNPDNPNALLALSLLKDIETNEQLSRLILSGTMKKLLPKTQFYPAFKVPKWPIIALFFCAGLTGLLVVFWPFKPLMQWIEQLGHSRSGNLFTNLSNLPADTEQLVASSLTYTLTANEQEQLYNKARNYFDNYQDNLALLSLNRLRHSNAPPELKHRATLMRRALRQPDFTAPPDTKFTLSEVLANPLLYEGGYVLWKGRLNDIQIDEQEGRIAFNFLVGYTDKQQLDGTIATYLYFNAFLEPSLPTEVLGQIMLDRNGKPYLKGISVHQQALP